MTDPELEEHATERTVWQGTPSQAINLPLYLLIGLGLIVATVGLLVLRAATRGDPVPDGGTSIYPWVIVGLWILGGIGALAAYLKVSTTKYVVTTERLRVTTGILSTVTEDLELRRVRDLIVRRPFWSRVMGLGDIEIMSADASTPRATLRSVRDPDGLQSKIRAAVHQQYLKYAVRHLEVD